MEIDNKKRPVTIEYSPNGKFLLVGNESDQICVYDLSKDSSIAKIFEAKARVLSWMDKAWTHKTEPKWTPSGSHICARWNKNLQIWAFDGQQFVEEKAIETTHDISDIAFSPDGRFLALGVGGSKISIYNWETKARI